MESIKFIKWWWKKLDSSMKGFICWFPCAIIFYTCLWYHGFATCVVVVCIAFLYLLFSLYRGLRNQISLYKEEKEKEAEEIILKLKGDDNPYPPDSPSYHFYKLRKLTVK